MAMINHNPRRANHLESQATVGGSYTHRGGRLTYWKMTGGAGTKGMSVVPSANNAREEVIASSVGGACVGVAMADIDQDNYGYFAVGGTVNLDIPDAVGAPGDPLGAGAAGAVVTPGTNDLDRIGVKLDEARGPDGEIDFWDPTANSGKGAYVLYTDRANVFLTIS